MGHSELRRWDKEPLVEAWLRRLVLAGHDLPELNKDGLPVVTVSPI